MRQIVLGREDKDASNGDQQKNWVKTQKAAYKIDFIGWQKMYFYFQEIMGFIWSSFVVAGLAGITKK